jgi:N-glycosylase/DNA lyase
MDQLLKNYFQLDIPLDPLYSHWSLVDENFRKKSIQFKGLRVLRQDPIENVFCFICSSNNNIKRITQMVTKLCQEYGKFVDHVDGMDFYTFPTIESLSKDDVESTLRTMGFGYRAKYIHQSALFLSKLPSDHLYKLRGQDYDSVKQELLKLPGVGPKVADCIALMSMDCIGAIPVDTHVWQIAVRDYHLLSKQKQKSLTEKTYKAIGDHFRELFGPYAGWAHSVLFAADLKSAAIDEDLIQETTAKRFKKEE